MNEVHYVIEQNEKGFFFNLVAANSEKVGGSFNEYYDTKAGCKRGIMDNYINTRLADTSVDKNFAAELRQEAYNKNIRLRIVDNTKGE